MQRIKTKQKQSAGEIAHVSLAHSRPQIDSDLNPGI